MDLGIKGKKVFVQASSTGIGFAIASAYAAEGAKVALCSSNQEKIERAAKNIPGSFPFVCDFTKEGASAKTTEQVIQALGGLDILVTNTGGPPIGPFLELSNSKWKGGFQSVWLSATEAIFEAARVMKEQKFGRILLSTSFAAKEPVKNLTISNSLRAGLLGLMKTLSFELAPHQITVNSILPGYLATERIKEFPMAEDEMKEKIPLGRLGKPEEFAALAVFLGSQHASYITGQAIACDGGAIRGL